MAGFPWREVVERNIVQGSIHGGRHRQHSWRGLGEASSFVLLTTPKVKKAVCPNDSSPDARAFVC